MREGERCFLSRFLSARVGFSPRTVVLWLSPLLGIAVGLILVRQLVRWSGMDERPPATAAPARRPIPSLNELLRITKHEDAPHYFVDAIDILDCPAGELVYRERVGFFERVFSLVSMLWAFGQVARLHGRVRGQCPLCSEFGLSWTVALDRSRRRFECETCQSSGGNFEFLMLSVPRWRPFRGPGQRPVRRALYVTQSQACFEEACKLCSPHLGPGDESCGGLAPVRPSGPWTPPSLQPDQVAVCLELPRENQRRRTRSGPSAVDGSTTRPPCVITTRP